jgi:Tfp pilus assembly protein PilO
MRIANRDRLWLLGGLVAALLLTVIAWQFFIKSQGNKTNSVKNDVVAAQQQVQDSTRELNQLRADSSNLNQYKAALAANQQALPTDTGVPAFLNELHAAGDATGVTIVSLTVGTPTAVTGAAAGSTSVQQMSLNMVATGPSDNLIAFVKQLQAAQPRAVLISAITESPGSGGQSSVSLTMNAFTTQSAAATPAAG